MVRLAWGAAVEIAAAMNRYLVRKYTYHRDVNMLRLRFPCRRLGRACTVNFKYYKYRRSSFFGAAAVLILQFTKQPVHRIGEDGLRLRGY